MGVSVDGFVAGPGDTIDWTMPDAELHQLHNDRVRAQGAQICGRKLYETMLYWETVDQDPSVDPVEQEFAALWQPLPKVVFSSTLTAVEGNARLATGSIGDELAALKAQTDGDIGIGGATLAAAFSDLGLIDEYHLFVSPIILGAGTPFFGPLDGRIPLELVETRTFASRVVLLRYRRT